MFSINTNEFSPEAKYYAKHGRYDDGEMGTKHWRDYWDEQEKRCIEGYSVGGVRITGRYYNYLNFSPIELVIKKTIGGRKVTERGQGFPRFWDEDYNFYHLKDIARYGISAEEYKKLELNVSVNPEHLVGKKHLVWIKPRGVGAEQPHNEVLITPNGETTMGEVKVGTELYDRSGNITKVTEVLPQGLKEVYEVELLDGRIVTCGENHLWTVETRIRDGKPEYKTLKTIELLTNGLSKPIGKNQKAYKYKIPELQPVKFKEKELIIPPYVLGALLGDGSINGKNIKIASDDIEIVDNIINKLNEVWVNDFEAVQDLSNNNYLLKLKDKFKYLGKYGENSKYGCNPLKQELELLNINVKCEEKHIPFIYKYGSIEQRLELVKGLMDTDGSVTSQGYCEFSNKSKKLINDLAYVLRSLGIYCSIGITKGGKEKTIIDRNSRSCTFIEEDCYRLYIATNQNIFHLKRKAKRISYNKRTRTSCPIISIKATGRFEKQSCIIVDNPEHLYLTKDFIVTHNSFKGGADASYNYHLLKKSKTFCLAASSEYLKKDGILNKFLDVKNFVANYRYDHVRKVGTHGFYQNALKSDNEEMFWRSGRLAPDGKTESGFLSEVYGVNLNGDPEKAKGKRGIEINFEELGKFPEADKAWLFARPSVEEGEENFGQLIGWGTGTEGIAFEAMEKMIYEPDTFNCISVNNQWDEGASGTFVSFFTPAFRSIGFIDENGNSLESKAKEHYDKDRANLAKSPDTSQLLRRKAEMPYCPREAVLNTSSNPFLSEGLLLHIEEVKRRKERAGGYLGLPVSLYYKEGKIDYKVDWNLKPIDTYPLKVEMVKNYKTDGCAVLFEPPFKDDKGNVPDNLYITCNDSYSHDESTDKTNMSLGATYVIENINPFTKSKGDRIVACYVGRPDQQDTYNDNMFKLAELYNAKIGAENNTGDVYGFARRNKKIKWLDEQFTLGFVEQLASKNVNRKFGMHMTGERKKQGLIYLKDFIYTIRAEDEETGKTYYNYHLIDDLGVLEELAKYNDKGNFDRISALIVGMYHKQEIIYLHKTVRISESSKSKYFKSLKDGYSGLF